MVGGGDGGVLRELDKHPKVREVHHCEIDEEVNAQRGFVEKYLTNTGF